MLYLMGAIQGLSSSPFTAFLLAFTRLPPLVACKLHPSFFFY